jgi:hypothetical protein
MGAVLIHRSIKQTSALAKAGHVGWRMGPWEKPAAPPLAPAPASVAAPAVTPLGTTAAPETAPPGERPAALPAPHMASGDATPPDPAVVGQ